MDAAEPGVPAGVGEGGPCTTSPQAPDARLHQLLEELRAALERLDLTMTRRHLALLELHADRVDETGPGPATFFARACRAMFALTEGDLVGATTMTDEASRIGASADLPEAEAVVRSLRNDRARQLGDREGMASGPAWCESRAREDGSMLARAEAAVLWLGSGDVARAGRLVDALQPRLEQLPDDDATPLVLSRVCEAAVGTGRRVAAATSARLLAPFAHRAVVAPQRHRVRRCRGRLPRAGDRRPRGRGAGTDVVRAARRVVVGPQAGPRRSAVHELPEGAAPAPLAPHDRSPAVVRRA